MQVEISQLTKIFPDGRVILDHIDWTDNVETVAIIGPSGGGKSTLLRILGGLLPQTSGTFSLDGLKVEDKNLTQYRKEIGFVFQQNGLFSHLSALENITLPLIKVHGYQKKQAEERAMELLEQFGLAQDYYKKPAKLSGGQQQRVSIARGISAKPRYLLLDEPTSALDPEYTNEVLSTVNTLKKEGIQFLIVTHEMGFARHACEKVAFLYQGKLWEYGESEAVFSNPSTPELERFLGKLLQWNI